MIELIEMQYGIGGRLLRGVKSLYVGSKACVRVGNEVSEWFPVRVGLRQGCVMSPWLFNLYIDGVVREVNARVLGRGLKLVDGNENEWELNQLLFADDTVVVADSERKLCQLLTEFGRVCERRKLRVNVGKSKVMSCTRSEDGVRLNVMLNGEALEEVDQFKYFGSVIAANGGVEADELSLRFIVLLLHGLSCDFSVMSDINLNEPGFTAPGNDTAPPLSDSSVDNPPEARRKCIACPRRMSAKTADRHTVCVVCRGFDCSLDSRCEECIEWPDEEVRLYEKLRKSLKSKDRSKHKSKPSASSPPPADFVPSSQPDALAIMQTQVDSLNSIVNSLAESLSARLDALTASLVPPSVPQSSSQTRQGLDAVQPQPGQTAGKRRTFQALVVDGRTSGANVYVSDQGVRAPCPEHLGPFAAPQPHVAPGSAPPPSDSFVPPQPPPRYGDPPPQPSTSAGGPSGPPPPRSTRDSRSSSERQRATSPPKITLRHACLTLFMRYALTRVRLRKPHVNRAAALRVGSASQSLQFPGRASDSTPGLVRWSRRWQLVRRLWLAVPSLFFRLFRHARVNTRLQIILFLLLHLL